MKRRYDFVFSLGGTCTCSTSLRKLGMQFASFPFDWASALSMEGNARVLVEGEERLMPIENLELLDSAYTGEGKVSYRNRDNGMWFVHDFLKGIDLRDQYPPIAEKYRRRMRRLYERIEASGSVLVVYTQLPNSDQTPDDVVLASQRMIADRFPGREIDLLYIAHEPGREYSDRRLVQLSPKVTKLSLDIRQKDADNELISDRRIIMPLIRELVPDGVVDYRTPEEVVAWKIKEHEKKYAKMHAKTRWEYLVNNFNWRMFRHFRNKLEKLGFENLPSHRA